VKEKMIILCGKSRKIPINFLFVIAKPVPALAVAIRSYSVTGFENVR
jgi:hypothetical protein